MTNDAEPTIAQAAPTPQPFSVGLFLLYMLTAVFLVAVLAVVSFETAYAGRIYPGVYAEDISLAGLTPAEAEALLRQQVTYYRDARIRLRYQDRWWEASPQDLGADLDTATIVATAYAVGRGGTIREDLQVQLEAMRFGHRLELRTAFDESRAQAYLAEIAHAIDRPVLDATLTLNGLTVRTTPSQIGWQVDVGAALSQVRDRVMARSTAPVDLIVRETYPRLPDVSEAKAQVEQLLSGPLVLKFEDQTWTLTPTDLAAMLQIYREPAGSDTDRLVVRLDEAALAAFVEPIGPQVYQMPLNARLDFDPKTKTITPIVPSQNGRTLDVAETVRRLREQAFTRDRVVPLAVRIEKPPVAVEDIPIMGIVELASQGTTSFKGSPAGRVRNIELAASKFQGVVIPPGGIFSFNQYLGKVSEEEGYEEAYIIYNNRTTVGLGGGICQVSTTAFRAAFWGGYPIVERWAHGYRVGWYEPPVGLDATIYAPQVDFKFQNDTPHYLLIETEVDKKKGTLTFFFYGTKPARTVEMEGPIVENVKPPGQPIYEEDPRLSPGEVKQVDWAKEGADVTVYRIIKQGDTVVAREKFFSRYHPWQDVFRVGPGGLPPTPTPTPAP